MSKHAGFEITRPQLDALRAKFDMLQGDRKAYFETYESTKKTNEQMIRDLRERNKDLRRQYAGIQKDGRADASGGGVGDVDKANTALATKRQQFDLLKAKTTAKTKELQELRDHFRDLELESKKPSTEDSPLTRKIRQLENRLDKAMIKYNEAQSIRKTYEQIVRRLNEERVGFDNQLAALERTLAAKEHDHEELMLLSGDAQHAKEVALSELERVRTFARQEKERRAKELREKKTIARARSETHALTRERERMRADMMGSLEGDEAARKAEHEMTEEEAEALREEREATRRKMDVYEEAFRKIKEATGVSDVNEVIQKIVSQDQQQANLKQLTKENQTRVELLNKELTSLKEHVDEVKYSGPGSKTGARKMVDSLEEKLAASHHRLERAKDQYERQAKILINVKAGIDHLTEKLHAVRGGEAQPILGDLSASASLQPAVASVAEASDETIVDVLAKCEDTLAEVMEKVEGEGEALEDSVLSDRPPTADAGLLGTGAPGGLSGAAIASLGISESDISATRQYNTRIELLDDDGPRRGFGGSGDDSGDEGDHYGMDDETCETRDSVKQASRITLSQHRKGGRKTAARRR